MNTNQLKNYSIIAVFIIALLILVSPYLLAVIWAGIFAIMFHPLHLWLAKKIPAKTSSGLITLFFTLIVLSPIVFFIILGINELQYYIAHPEYLKELIETSRTFLSQLPIIGPMLKNSLANFNFESFSEELFNLDNAGRVFPLLQYTGSSIARLTINLFIIIVFLYQFLLKAPAIKRIAEEKIFSGFKQDLIQKNVIPGTRTVALSILLTGFITGTIMSITYTFLGFTTPVFLGVFTGCIALIPFLLPIFYLLLLLILLVKKMYLSMILVAIIGYGSNFFTDNILQPRLLQKNTRLNFAASLLGILSGIEILGPLGVFLGPILLNVAIYLLSE